MNKLVRMKKMEEETMADKRHQTIFGDKKQMAQSRLTTCRVQTFEIQQGNPARRKPVYVAEFLIDSAIRGECR